MFARPWKDFFVQLNSSSRWLISLYCFQQNVVSFSFGLLNIKPHTRVNWLSTLFFNSFWIRIENSFRLFLAFLLIINSNCQFQSFEISRFCDWIIRQLSKYWTRIALRYDKMKKMRWEKDCEKCSLKNGKLLSEKQRCIWAREKKIIFLWENFRGSHHFFFLFRKRRKARTAVVQSQTREINDWK